MCSKVVQLRRGVGERGTGERGKRQAGHQVGSVENKQNIFFLSFPPVPQATKKSVDAGLDLKLHLKANPFRTSDAAKECDACPHRVLGQMPKNRTCIKVSTNPEKTCLTHSCACTSVAKVNTAALKRDPAFLAAVD